MINAIQLDKINSMKDLRKSIALLEAQHEENEINLKEAFTETIEKLNPATLVKNKFREITSAPDLKSGVVNVLMSAAAGYLTKVVVVGKTKDPFRMLLGSFTQIAMTSVIAKNAETIKSTGMHVFGSLFNRKEKAE